MAIRPRVGGTVGRRIGGTIAIVPYDCKITFAIFSNSCYDILAIQTIKPAPGARLKGQARE